jgi:hypothetical protein
MFEDEAESSRRWQRLTIDGKVRTIDIVFTEGVGNSAAQRSAGLAVLRASAVSIFPFSRLLLPLRARRRRQRLVP